LTSAPALSALRELPTTNIALYQEIAGGKTNKTLADDEPAFSADIEGEDDGSDVPVAVIQTVVVSGGSVVADGFRIGEGGNIVRTGDVEELEGRADEPANSLTADFRNFRIFSYSLGRV
jgi:hypothetical protein